MVNSLKGLDHCTSASWASDSTLLFHTRERLTILHFSMDGFSVIKQFVYPQLGVQCPLTRMLATAK